MNPFTDDYLNIRSSFRVLKQIAQPIKPESEKSLKDYFKITVQPRYGGEHIDPSFTEKHDSQLSLGGPVIVPQRMGQTPS